ncbi:uncharacterized protein LOC109408589 isoform X2 [Aedes albopictus]|uniref:Uncharacterized protein n=1 Tax=Aedes albopictus TaxID=7160 RepID=A0ABM1ZY11_AEDAL
MEYLSRTNKDRPTSSRRLHPVPEPQESNDADNTKIVHSTDDIVEAERELRFIVPTPQTKSHVIELWNTTFEQRQKYRSEDRFYPFAQECPVFTAYDGELISLDFNKIKPSSKSFLENWDTIERNVSSAYRELYKELKNDFVRTLAIIRLKNPSRGSKRVRDEEASRRNPLKGIVQWINADDDFPSHGDQNSTPILYARGTMFEDSTDCAIVWGNIVFPLLVNIKSGFSILMKSLYVFNVSGAACDKQFYLFIAGAVLGIEQLSTTGLKFLHSVT